MEQEKKNKSITKELVILALPSVLEEVFKILLQYVDTAMVGHLGEKATAAVSTTTSIGWLTNSFMHSIGIALLAMMSKSVGENNNNKLNKLAGHAIFLVLMAGIVVGAISLSLAKFIPIWMGTEEDVRPDASKYYFIISVPMIFRAGTLMFGSCIRATLDTKSPMIVNGVCNIINVILDYLLIYTFHLGVSGAAYATAITHLISGTLMFIVFAHKKQFNLSWSSMKIDKNILIEISKIALPAAATQACSCFGYIVFAGLVSGMGTSIFAAHSIAINAETWNIEDHFGINCNRMGCKYACSHTRNQTSEYNITET